MDVAINSNYSLFSTKEIRREAEDLISDYSKINSKKNENDFFDQANEMADEIVFSLFGNNKNEDKKEIVGSKDYHSRKIAKLFDSVGELSDDEIKKTVIDNSFKKEQSTKSSLLEIGEALGENFKSNMPSFYQAIQEEDYDKAIQEIKYTSYGSKKENGFYKNNKEIVNYLITGLMEKQSRTNFEDPEIISEEMNYENKEVFTSPTAEAEEKINVVEKPIVNVDEAKKLNYKKGMSVEQIKKIQKKIGVKVDGKWGDTSSVALDILKIKEMNNISKPNTPRLFATGKYQVIPVTLMRVLKSGAIKASDKYNEATQDKIAEYLMTKVRPAIHKYIFSKNKKMSKTELQEAQLQLAKEWASFPIPYNINTTNKNGSIIKKEKGSSYYSGSGGNKAHMSLAKVEAALNKSKKDGNFNAMKKLLQEGESGADGYNAYNQGRAGDTPSKVTLTNLTVGQILKGSQNKKVKK